MIALIEPGKLPEQEVAFTITGSKSESNRLLLLQALFPELQVSNLSESDDTRYLTAGLKEDSLVDIHHAGTAMRFLTAYFAAQPGKEITLTGSERMQQRPIKILVEALRSMGADISYAANEGFPPLRIRGKKLETRSVDIQANTSSQYISALMLMAPSLEQGLDIHLQGTITSRPYIEMTLSLLHQLGIQGTFEGQVISIAPQTQISQTEVVVESDWSSASYFYSLVALAPQLRVRLSSYRANSLQGDSALQQLYQAFGVTTEFDVATHSIVLRHNQETREDTVVMDLVQTPDLAQTIAVTCFGQGRACDLTGLHTLKIKETDRLIALQNELRKLGADIEVTNDSLHLKRRGAIQPNQQIATYHDHRMAMAFAPLALLTSLTILDAGVVSKSFPGFWEDMARAGIQVNLQ